MEKCVCENIFSRIQEALASLMSTTANVMSTNSMSLSDSGIGIGSLQTISLPNTSSNILSNLNLLLLFMSMIIILSFLSSRNKSTSIYN